MTVFNVKHCYLYLNREEKSPETTQIYGDFLFQRVRQIAIPLFDRFCFACALSRMVTEKAYLPAEADSKERACKSVYVELKRLKEELLTEGHVFTPAEKGAYRTHFADLIQHFRISEDGPIERELSSEEQNEVIVNYYQGARKYKDTSRSCCIKLADFLKSIEGFPANLDPNLRALETKDAIINRLYEEAIGKENNSSGSGKKREVYEVADLIHGMYVPQLLKSKQNTPMEPAAPLAPPPPDIPPPHESGPDSPENPPPPFNSEEEETSSENPDPTEPSQESNNFSRFSPGGLDETPIPPAADSSGDYPPPAKKIRLDEAVAEKQSTSKKTRHHYTEEQRTFLKNIDRNIFSVDQITDQFNELYRKGKTPISRHSIHHQLSLLGNKERIIALHKRWTKEEDAFIEDNYLSLSAEEMSKQLPGRTEASIFSRRKTLGLEVKCKKHTHEEIERVRELKNLNLTAKQVLEKFNENPPSGHQRTLGAINDMIASLTKTPN